MRRKRGSVTLGYLAVAGLLLLAVAAVLLIAPLAVGALGPLYQGLDQGIGEVLIPPVNGTSGAPALLYPNTPLPSDYATLANFTLTLINQDRNTAGGLSPVSLGPRLAAQQHAYSMLVNDYLSHWDTQGLKPYMRYTIAGGVEFMAENVAFINSPGSYRSSAAVEEAIKRLEYEMVYNDASHNWGHRDNILDPYHTSVSIGIAYNSDSVYLVQDFTSDYVNWTAPLTMTGTGVITLSGTLVGGKGLAATEIQMVQLFYDPLPTSVTSSQLAVSPYNGAYDQGLFLGGVVPQGYTVPKATTVTASQWETSGSRFQITFNLGPVIKAQGPGCYTLYLALDDASGKQVLLTSYTMFVNSQG